MQLRRWGMTNQLRYDTRRALKIDSSMIEISHNVSQALKNNEPIVALESTIITHGMPYPANLETALKVESAIKVKVLKFIISLKYVVSFSNWAI